VRPDSPELQHHPLLSPWPPLPLLCPTQLPCWLAMRCTGMLVWPHSRSGRYFSTFFMMLLPQLKAPHSSSPHWQNMPVLIYIQIWLEVYDFLISWVCDLLPASWTSSRPHHDCMPGMLSTPCLPHVGHNICFAAPWHIHYCITTNCKHICLRQKWWFHPPILSK